MKLSRIAFMRPTETSEVEPRSMINASLPEVFAPPQPPAVTGHTQPFGSAAQNGRLAASLGDPRAVAWAPRFTAPLRANTRARSVLKQGDTILVQAGVWQLFRTDGSLVRAGSSGPSPLVISDDGTFRLVDADGYLAAHSLATGDELWTFGLRHGDSAGYPFVGVRGGRTVVLSGERFTNPEADPRPLTTLAVEVLTLNGETEVSPGGNLLSGTTSGALVTEFEGTLYGAVADDAVIVAWPGHLMTLGYDLAVRSIVTATFSPRALATGDGGRVYLIATTPDGPELWMVNAAGERVFAASLPDELSESMAPPIVAPDHRVFVVTEKRVIGFSPTGEFLWEFVPPNGRPYASVTCDGWLLVAVEHSIGVLDQFGRGLSIYADPGAMFRTPPVLTAEGEILVATDDSLVGLRFEPFVEMGERTIVR